MATYAKYLKAAEVGQLGVAAVSYLPGSVGQVIDALQSLQHKKQTLHWLPAAEIFLTTELPPRTRHHQAQGWLLSDD